MIDYQLFKDGVDVYLKMNYLVSSSMSSKKSLELGPEDENLSIWLPNLSPSSGKKCQKETPPIFLGNSPLTSLPKNFPQFSKKLFETLCQSWLLDLLKKGKKGENYRNWVQQKEWHAAAAAATANPTTAIEEIAWLLHQEKKKCIDEFFLRKKQGPKINQFV